MFNFALPKNMFQIKTKKSKPENKGPYTLSELDKKLIEIFPGKVVRKGLSKQIKGSSNVPVFVLEYLLGTQLNGNEEVSEGIKNIKTTISRNYVRPDEAELIKSKIRESGNFKIIDKLTVKLNEKKDIYEVSFANLGLSNVEIGSNYVTDFNKLLGSGIWCMVRMGYDSESENSPFVVLSLNPLQIPNSNLRSILEARHNFSKEEWINILLRSVGLEPTKLSDPAKWHLIERLVPFVESNYNLCELGPRSTGKSFVYKEISSNSILVSGGQTTVSNLFYNMTSKRLGLVGNWDVVAFDEVAGINFKDKDLTQIMKDYMASGSFSRGREMITSMASIVMVGNINNSVSELLSASHLFAPFPATINNDTAFFDRFHYYLPGWEVPKLRPEHFTEGYGFMVDYISEFFREMRKRSFSDYINQYFWLGDDLNQRDVQAVKKTFSGLMKLIYPDENITKEQAAEILEYALVGRRRVKEQLKTIGGDEFADINFSYIDAQNRKEHRVNVPETKNKAVSSIKKLIKNNKVKN